MWRWLTRQYDDIKGNLKWAILGALWWVVNTYGKRTLQMIPHIPDWAINGTLLLLSVIAFLWVAKLKPANAFPEAKDKPEARPEPRLQIYSAFYGTGSDNDRDVTRILQEAAKDALAFQVENNSFGVDPAPMRPKRLEVEYSYGNRSVRKVARQEGTLLVLPEDSESKRVTSELELWKKNFAETSRQRDDFQQKYAACENRAIQLDRELGSRIKLPLTPLEIDALYMTVDLVTFLKELGPPPTPKYTSDDVYKMPSDKMKTLIEAGDIDFAEACEYYELGGAQPAKLNAPVIAKWKQKYPWYQKLEAGYALRFKDRVETLRNRFLLEGITDDGAFQLPVEYRDGAKNIRTIAAKCWEFAYRGFESRTQP